MNGVRRWWLAYALGTTLALGVLLGTPGNSRAALASSVSIGTFSAGLHADGRYVTLGSDGLTRVLVDTWDRDAQSSVNVPQGCSDRDLRAARLLLVCSNQGEFPLKLLNVNTGGVTNVPADQEAVTEAQTFYRLGADWVLGSASFGSQTFVNLNTGQSGYAWDHRLRDLDAPTLAPLSGCVAKGSYAVFSQGLLIRWKRNSMTGPIELQNCRTGRTRLLSKCPQECFDLGFKNGVASWRESGVVAVFVRAATKYARWAQPAKVGAWASDFVTTRCQIVFSTPARSADGVPPMFHARAGRLPGSSKACK